MLKPPARSKYADDPDETAGRALYRARADVLARMQMALARHPVRWAKETKEADDG